MKRKWIKILSSMLTILTFSLIIFVYIWTCYIFFEYQQPYHAVHISLRLKFPITLSYICVIMSITSIILDSIDLSETINEDKKFKLPVVLIALNSVNYLLAILYIPLLIME